MLKDEMVECIKPFFDEDYYFISEEGEINKVQMQDIVFSIRNQGVLEVCPRWTDADFRKGVYKRSLKEAKQLAHTYLDEAQSDLNKARQAIDDLKE